MFLINQAFFLHLKKQSECAGYGLGKIDLCIVHHTRLQISVMGISMASL